VRTQYRKIFTLMGFEEMPTNNYVESSFWNFDALFQPQQVRVRAREKAFSGLGARICMCACVCARACVDGQCCTAVCFQL
jgi:hypothetical protein